MTTLSTADPEEEQLGTWEVRRGPIRLATLKELSRDFPWMDCSFFQDPEFEPFRYLFDRSGDIWRGKERQLHEAISRKGIHLTTPDGERLRAFTLVLSGSGARLTFTQV